VGYRYYELREIEPLFPFGHGLSYTTFEYSEWTMPEVVKRGETVKLYVKVKNTGAVAGKEVAQLYVSDKQASVQRPVKELKGFAKVALQSGEEKTVGFELNERALAYYDPDRKAWVAEPGEFEALIGSSSQDIRLKAKFTLK
jgi:beta-glucosidase